MNGGSDLPAPQREPRCPICGAANGCAVAKTGSFDSPCWCRDVTFGPELLERVPADQVGRACICGACARSAALRGRLARRADA